MMEENYFVIRSSSFKLVSMLLMHPNLVAHNVKNIFKINKKINLNLETYDIRTCKAKVET